MGPQKRIWGRNCDDLLEDEIYACGTVHKDRRGVPQAIVTTTIGSSTRMTNLLQCILLTKNMHNRFILTIKCKLVPSIPFFTKRGEYKRGNLVVTTWRDR